MEPLLDIEGRTLALGPRTQLDVVLDALLRMQNAASWKKPITLYLGLGMDVRYWLGLSETLQICSVIQCLRSSVHTVALAGLLHGYEPIVLAAGCRGHRYLLKHTLTSLGPVQFPALPFAKGSIGLAPNRNGPSWEENVHALLSERLDMLMRELNLSPHLFSSPRIVGAVEAIRLGLADAIVPCHTQVQKPSQEPPSHQLNFSHDHED